jgi:short-subunit dehydrogenase
MRELHRHDHASSEEEDVMKNKVALVTGASSGIGEATAARLAAAGYTVYGTSRRGAAAGKRAFEMLALDVTRDESVEAVVSEVLRRSGRIDLLVNNAGFGVGLAGDEESSVAQAQAIFDTNFFGTVRMTRAVVPQMRRQAAGRILNIGSALGFVPMPYMAIYSASKHALEGYSESLDHELRTRGVRVVVIEPGVTKTPFDANLLEPDAKIEEYREIRTALNRRYLEVVAAGDAPEAVAEVVLKAANAVRPKLRYPVGRVATFQFLRRFAPGLVDAGIRRDLRLDAPIAASSGAKP